MSKSKGNVVDPLDVVKEFGADVLRVYVLFMGDYASATPWSDNSVRGCKRFLDRVASLLDMAKGSGVTQKLESAFHKTIKKVTSDIEEMKFNTAIAALMTLLNDIYEVGSITTDEVKTFAKLLAPFAPHIAEEIWETLGGEGFISLTPWPEYDEAKTKDSEIEIAVQICGKMRGTIDVPAGAEEDVAFDLIMKDEKLASFFAGKTIVKKIYVKNKIFNIIAK
jgi:leucyl-tRNA synthetase